MWKSCTALGMDWWENEKGDILTLAKRNDIWVLELNNEEIDTAKSEIDGMNKAKQFMDKN